MDEFPLTSPEIRELILRNEQEIIHRGLEELREIDPFIDPDSFTSLSTLVAYAYTVHGNADSALYWLQWMDDSTYNEVQYPARMIGLFVITGIFQRTKIEVEELKRLMAAQRIAEEKSDEFNQSLAQAYRGVALLARGLERDGFPLLEASIKRFEDLGYLKQARNYQANLAAFHIRTGMYKQALEILSQLIALPNDEISSEFRSYSASNAALSYIRLGMLEESDTLIDKGLSIAEDAGFMLGILYALNLRANYFLELGQWEEAKTALDELEDRDSVDLIMKADDLRSFNALMKGRYFEHLNEYQSARIFYQEAALFSTPGSKFPDFGKAYEGLHRVSIATGNLKEAQQIFSTLNRIRDSLLIDKTQAGLELYETERLLEIQAEQLEDNQRKLEAEMDARQHLIAALFGVSLLFIILFLVFRNRTIKREREKTEASNFKLSEYTQELEELAFVVSHNLRESARNISTYTGLFSREVGDEITPKGKTYLNFMYKASLRTSEMLGDLETYVGIGSHLPEGKSINLNHVWENVLSTKEAEIGHLDIQVYKDNLPSMKGHSPTLELLFTELLDNSIKYRKGDSLALTISYSNDGNCHQISFSDNGIGFSEVYKEKIFRVFQRLHSNEEIPGTGIGLPIIDKVIRLYGGKVEVKSEEGKGATFILMLPASVIVG